MNIFVLILLIILVSNEYPGINAESKNKIYTHYQIGRRLDGDVLIKEAIVSKRPKKDDILNLFDAKAEHTAVFTSNALQNKIITAVKASELYESGLKTDLAKFEVLKGGVGKKEVTLKFTSKRGSGFKYKIYIFGY